MKKSDFIKLNNDILEIDYMGMKKEMPFDDFTRGKRRKIGTKKLPEKEEILEEFEINGQKGYLYTNYYGEVIIENSLANFKLVREIATNLFPIFYKRKNSINLLSIVFYRLEKQNKDKKYNQYIYINEKNVETKRLLKRGMKLFTYGKYTYFFNIYKAKFEMDFLKKCPIQNSLKLKFENADEEHILPLVYNIIYRKKFKGKTSKVYKIQNTDNTVCYFRQGAKNSTHITVRQTNITDALGKRIKLNLAYWASKIIGSSDRLLLYEKECNKYEESAAMLYEKLIDTGYNNAYFVIKKDSKHTEFIKPKYQKNIIWAHTFKHYLNFFRCHKFIGTESLHHLIELRTVNRNVMIKIRSKEYKYVFLQHGVMYMVSLNSKGRSFFRKGNEMPDDAKIVVSSHLEAKHFVDLGGFKPEDLYITGLPFYDRTIKKKEADKITIMPTWRPWDYNTLATNYKESSYYNMVLNIYENVPDELKNKIILLPHPLVLNIFKQTPLGKYIPEITSYDLILEDTALLITDYSSIAYSAFYRGANVIFVWRDMEECMEHYGGHLMLNNTNAFGDISYNYKELNKLIKNNYLNKQDKDYINRYRKIVEFHDNKNTDRLIKKLEEDKFL